MTTFDQMQRDALVDQVVTLLIAFLRIDPLDDAYPLVSGSARTFLDGEGALDQFARQRIVRLTRHSPMARRIMIKLRASNPHSLGAQRAADILRAARPKPRFR